MERLTNPFTPDTGTLPGLVGNDTEGVEDEDTGLFSDDGGAPFSAAEIDIYPQQATVFSLMRRIREKELDLAPNFQRGQNLWKPQQQSQFIESLVLGIPVPVFYFTEERTVLDGIVRSRWQVVDGLQRLCSIRNFMIPDDSCRRLRLTGLEYLKQFEGKLFPELPGPIQRNIEESQLSTFIIRSSTPIAVRFNIFKRLNTGGVPLSQQEIRHALNQGVASDFLRDMAQSPLFSDATRHKISPNRMNDREFVNRFLAFRILPLSEYRDMDSFLNLSLQKFASLDVKKRDIVRSDFLDSLSAIRHSFADKAFCRFDIVSGKWLSNINKALFEVLVSSVSKLSVDARQRFSNNPNSLQEFQKLFSDDTDEGLSSVCSISTGRASRVRRRHEIVHEYLNNVAGQFK